MQELARLLGRPAAQISQKLQGLLSAESIYCLNSLLESDMPTSSLQEATPTSYPQLATPTLTSPSNDKTDELIKLEEDGESGFEDGSNLSKSNNMTDSIIR